MLDLVDEAQQPALLFNPEESAAVDELIPTDRDVWESFVVE